MSRPRTLRQALLGLAVLLPCPIAVADPAADDSLLVDQLVDGYEFVERQYFLVSPQSISVNGDDESLVFEAQLALHVPFVGFRLTPQADPEAGFVIDARLLFTFLSRLRMTGADSSPVVTPSYMPRLRFQVLGRRVLGGDVELQLGGTALLAHHSNGQQDCTFRDRDGNTTIMDAEGGTRCLSPREADFLNEDGGSFSTNYYGVEVHGRISFDAEPRLRSPSIFLSAALEHHPKGFLWAGALDNDLSPLWGNLHLDARAEGRLPLVPGSDDLHWLEPYAAVELYRASQGRDERLPLIDVDNHRVMVEGGVVCPKCYRIGVFARGVFGRDYYNIQFSQSRSRFQAGVVFDTSFGTIPPREAQSGDPGDTPFPDQD